MYCIDPSKFYIRGDLYASSNARLAIDFSIPESLCRNDEYDMECVTTRDFDNSMASKYIFTYHNRVRFDADKYTENAHVIPETVFKWFKFPTTAKVMDF